MTKEMTQWMNERCQCPFKYCNDQNFALECVCMYLCMNVISENTSPHHLTFPAGLFIVSKQPSTQRHYRSLWFLQLRWFDLYIRKIPAVPSRFWLAPPLGFPVLFCWFYFTLSHNLLPSVLSFFFHRLREFLFVCLFVFPLFPLP